MKSVPFFNYPSVYLKNRTEYLQIFDEVCSKGSFILQDELSEFERNLSKYVGSNFALGVGNATDALQLLLMASQIQPGSQVLVSAHTMIATASAIKMAGLIPVPIDIGSDGLMDPDKIVAALTPATKAIMPTQLNGRVCDMDRILEIAVKHKLLIFEDSAQALGAKYNSVCAGNFGVGGCISFYPAKTLGCFGDGGAVICNDEKIYNKVKALRDHGRNALGDVEYWGYNSRLDNIQAAFLNFDLKGYDATIVKRRELATIYNELLSDQSQLLLPPSLLDPKYYDVYQNFEIQAENRDGLREYLKECGVGTLVQWGGKLLHQHKTLGFAEKLPNADLFSAKYLMIPLNTSMTSEDAVYVANCIRKYYQ